MSHPIHHQIDRVHGRYIHFSNMNPLLLQHYIAAVKDPISHFHIHAYLCMYIEILNFFFLVLRLAPCDFSFSFFNYANCPYNIGHIFQYSDRAIEMYKPNVNLNSLLSLIARIHTVRKLRSDTYLNDRRESKFIKFNKLLSFFLYIN
jgi:hypothetical protein